MNLLKKEELLDELYSYSKFGIKLGLENIDKLLNELGNIENNYKKIHIAGTNGKGSVATMLETILIESGYNVGKYTSPHLVDFNERITVNNKKISDEELVECFLEVKKAIKSLNIQPTFFEVTTAIMFLYFDKKNIDWGIIETGMGGQYDSTNVIVPEVSIITNVTVDHTNYLGKNLREIAKEKAGIIKKDVPVIYYGNCKELIEEVEKKSVNRVNIGKYNYKVEFDNEKFSTVIDIDNEIYEIPLYGEFQSKNFLLAYETLKKIGVSKKDIKKGLKNVKWPGRFEVIEKNPYLILDGAHNIAAALGLKRSLLKKFKREEILVITSILKDKDVNEILDIFSKFADTAIFVSLKTVDRGLSEEEMYKLGSGKFDNSLKIDDINEAIKVAKENFDKKAIIIAGSLYLIGEVKKGRI
ncbi:bifunctional folylpolyglutamate synthase/dihydrofolate synthase [Haliovirga abyssi]|uniref:tetrahydrofolate synthase n=1 Tax=Haliovirga abyssi TaxID=2996794 RepID=A0AAU9DX68_9FUSO|nr:folylpolyglutamate synthase/dihydrofolate synthase family protein [Haliovirga abyssi]BDU50986.1 diaminohydroxyphosphoribosylaminopyrimidine deaminase [Haliovirga abyssi]